MTWSAEQYVAFADQRTRPVRDLLAAVPATQVRTAMDLGCGPGNSTELLAARFPKATVSGLDSSNDMLAAAPPAPPAVDFTLDTIENWLDHDGPAVDVVLANAVLQWVPDHATVLPAIVGRLGPQGVLAVQMPDNLSEPAHVLMRRVAQLEPWADKLENAAAARTAMLDVPTYYHLLLSLGCRVEIWRTTYYHPLSGGTRDVIEWFKGSGLRPFLTLLDASEQALFLSHYQALLAEAYPVLPDGSVLLPFPRLFLLAVRP